MFKTMQMAKIRTMCPTSMLAQASVTGIKITTNKNFFSKYFLIFASLYANSEQNLEKAT
jgi:hypothetical protein